MPLPARNSSRRRKKKPDRYTEERTAGGRAAAEVAAPMRMKLRDRRGDGTAAGASGAGGSVGGATERGREGGKSSSRRKNSNRTSASATAAAASTSSSLPTTSTWAVMAAEETSPDSKCPICLDRFNNLAYLDHCLHRFCFPCIQEWSHNKAECPLCKQPFASILHSVRAEDDFKEYTLQPPPPPDNSVAATVAMVAAMASAARSDHHMRLMLRRHRVADGRETTARRRRRARGARGRARGVWELYFDHPTLSFPPLPRHLSPDSEEELAGERVGPDALFDQLTGLRGAAASNSREVRRLMNRLAARRRRQREGGTAPRLREGQTLDFRRMLYRCGVRVRGVAGVNGNLGQQRDVTAESFHQSSTHLNRLRPWLRRELRAMYGSNSSLVDMIQNIVMARLALHGLEDTLRLGEELQPFLQARTPHFLHELQSFARSPLSMDAYDLQAVYEPPPTATMELDGLSSSSEGSSVIAISEEEEEERRGRSEGTVSNDISDIIQTGSSLSDIIQTGSSLSLSGWDDETPGPSYSTASLDPLLPLSPAPQEPAVERGGDAEGECLIVGYKKPMAERTPELVQLSSDSEEEEGEKTKKEEEQPLEKAPPLPSPTPSSTYLPISPPSTSGAFREEQEVWGRRPRSWSGSSGRSRKSVRALDSASPQRRRDDGQSSRRKKRKKKRRREGVRRSGTFSNPNRSIYPPMMRRCSPLLFDSSADSCSPLPSSPDFHCVSPLTSPVSSPFCLSPSSPLCLSPQRTPQTPRSSSPAELARHAEKPGGKRKYKSRHLNSSAKDPTWRQSGGRQGEKRRRRKERPRKEVQQETEESRKRSRADRSPSVEIIYEGTVSSNTERPLGHKRRRKRHRERTRYSSPPVVITLDSDSSRDRKFLSCSSSSQHTIDFSDLPPLPLVHLPAVGGALDEEMGELPVEILDRGSDRSGAEAAGRINISDDSDVENMEDDSPLQNHNMEDDSPLQNHDGQTDARRFDPAAGPKPSGADGHGGGDTRVLRRVQSPSDRSLLDAILCDLNRMSAAEQNQNQNLESSSSPDARKNSPQDGPETEPGLDSGSSSAPSPPPLDVPPLLKRAGSARSCSRNAPPPLRHKDAGSPQQSAGPPHATSDPARDPARDPAPRGTPRSHMTNELPGSNRTNGPPESTPHKTPPPVHSNPVSSSHSTDPPCRGLKPTGPDCRGAPVELHPPDGVESSHAAAPPARLLLDRRSADGRFNHVALTPLQHTSDSGPGPARSLRTTAL